MMLEVGEFIPGSLPRATESNVLAIKLLEKAVLEMPQIDMPTQHVFHAGMYARSIMIPAGCVITGALIKIPTLLIIDGDTLVTLGDVVVRFTGHNVLMGEAGRKQAFLAYADTNMTMIFATAAKTVEEAEAEFTEEFNMLMSHNSANEVLMSQVQP